MVRYGDWPLGSPLCLSHARRTTQQRFVNNELMAGAEAACSASHGSLVKSNTSSSQSLRIDGKDRPESPAALSITGPPGSVQPP